MPYSSDLERRILWSARSKAFLKSTRTTPIIIIQNRQRNQRVARSEKDPTVRVLTFSRELNGILENMCLQIPRFGAIGSIGTSRVITFLLHFLVITSYIIMCFML